MDEEQRWLDRYGRYIQPHLQSRASDLSRRPYAQEHDELLSESSPLLTKGASTKRANHYHTSSAASSSSDGAAAAGGSFYDTVYANTDDARKTHSIASIVAFYFPIVQWIQSYRFGSGTRIIRDVVSAINLALMYLPQGIAYSYLAGVQPQYGLFTSAIPIFVYFFMGQSKQASIGPEGMSCVFTGHILVQTYLTLEIQPSSMELARLASFLSIMTGLWLVLFSFVNISFIENLISRPILCGFVSATGLLIIIEQSSELFGINLLYHDWFRFIELVFRIQSANIATFVLGFVSIILHLAIESAKRYPTRYERNTLVSLIPTTFIVVACGLAVSVLLDLPNEYHVEVIGPIDTSAFLIPWLPLPSGIFLAIRQTVVPSATLAIFIMAHSIGTSKAFSKGKLIKAERELFALGTLNVVGGFFRCFPSNTSLFRTETSSNTKSSHFAGLGAAILVTAAIFTSLEIIQPIPRATMAAVVIAIAIRGIDFDIVKHIKIRAWLDISMFVITLVATFWLGPVQGSYIALGLSAYQYIKRVTLPNISVLGQCTRTGEWHEPGEVPDICTIEGIVVLRIKYRLFFGNVDQLRAIMARIDKFGDRSNFPEKLAEAIVPNRAIILDVSTVQEIDKLAIIALHSLIHLYFQKGKLLMIVGLSSEFCNDLKALGLPANVPFYESVSEAVDLVNIVVSSSRVA